LDATVQSSMRLDLLELLVCPECNSTFKVEDERRGGGEIQGGELVCAEGHVYPIVDAIPRFVSEDDYADAFGLEWNAFRTAHLEKFTGLSSRAGLSWTPAAGSGASARSC
jgi:uncharacterized protein YbaR (Trm112 family)